ncbi:putative capsular polysaccharide synthesis family protein, partial [Vibrio harveyi]|uniref:putative capsular polysaccharide synthesis family protein n=1 Tax=Vibrio harveyi TaxID=669 RepID=UPI000A3F786A
FNIDVLRQEIDNTQPFYTFSNEKASVILIKCEQLSSLDKEIGEFLQLDDFILKNSNEAKNKWYSNIHQYFKERYDFSKLFYMYDLPLYLHLYSEQERAAFKNKWKQTPGTKA